MHLTWAVFVMIFAIPLCSGHLPFFGYYSQNKNDSVDSTGTPPKSFNYIFPSRRRPTVTPIEHMKYNGSSSIPFKYQFPSLVNQSTVPIKMQNSNISSPTIQFQSVSVINQSISISTAKNTEPTNSPEFPPYSQSTGKPTETAIFQNRIRSSITQSQSASVIIQSISTPSAVVEGETNDHFEQPQSPAVPQSVIDPIELTIFQKHEFEGEIPDDDYHDTDECVNTTVSAGSGQEIDETRNCSFNTTTTTTETTQEIDESDVETDDSGEMRERNFNFALGSFVPPVSKLPKIEIPTLAKLPLELLGLKPKTVTLTNYIVRPSTVHVSQYASCLQLENVYSVCNQNLVTIQPTSVMQGHSTMYKRDFNSHARMNFELRDTPFMQEDEFNYPLVRGSNGQKHPVKAHSIADNILEPGELDYEFEEISPAITPNLKSASVLQDAWSKVNENAISGLKIKQIDVIIPSLTTKTHFDHGLTATIIAQNCLPLNLDIPFCSSMFVYQFDINV